MTAGEVRAGGQATVSSSLDAGNDERRRDGMSLIIVRSRPSLVEGISRTRSAAKSAPESSSSNARKTRG